MANEIRLEARYMKPYAKAESLISITSAHLARDSTLMNLPVAIVARVISNKKAKGMSQ